MASRLTTNPRPLKLFVFGDQTHDVSPTDIKELVHFSRESDNPVLGTFFDRACRLLRTEIAAYQRNHQYGPDHDGHVLRLTGPDDFSFWQRGKCVPVDMAMLCVHQLGLFMRHVGSTCYAFEGTYSLGLCTGALAAAAVSCSGNILELLGPAVRAVGVAFRTGVLVENMARRLEEPDPIEKLEQQHIQPWTLLMAEATGREAVQKVCCDKFDAPQQPLTAKPWISAYAPNAIAVTGPPSSLVRLTASEHCQSLRTRSVPTINAPYHAPHLFSQDNVEEVIRDLKYEGKDDKTVKIPAISSTSSEILPAKTFHDMICSGVKQILMQPINWPLVLDQLRKISVDRGLDVVPIATVADQLIYKALPNQGRIPPSNTHTIYPSLSRTNTTSRDHATECAAITTTKIAIVGMACRLPGSASTPSAFWALLQAGIDTAREIPPYRWDVNTHIDASGIQKNTAIGARYACLVDDPGLFDAAFFGMNDKQALMLDPAVRMALMVTHEAIEQAGVVVTGNENRIGNFWTVSDDDWRTCNAAQEISDEHFNALSGQQSITSLLGKSFRFSGPSLAVDAESGGNTGLSAIQMAFDALLQRKVDVCIAGGATLITNPDIHAGLDRARQLSWGNSCGKVFDDEADGYCRGEGVAVLVMRRLDDAVTDGDPILGVLAGAMATHDNASEPKSVVLTKMLNTTNVEPNYVDYVEMSASGLKKDDAAEVASVLDVFAPSDVAKHHRPHPLYIGSAKTNVGYGKGISGISAVIKVVMMLQNDSMPPHVGIRSGKMNAKFPQDMRERGVEIVTKKAVTWKRKGHQPRRALVNSWNMTDHAKSAVLVEDAPRPSQHQEGADDATIQEAIHRRPCHLIAVSARSETSLRGNLSVLRSWLHTNEHHVSIPQLEYTTTARRVHHPYREMLAISDVKDLVKQLESLLSSYDIGVSLELHPSSSHLDPRNLGESATIFSFAGTDTSYILSPSTSAFLQYSRELYRNFSSFSKNIQQLDHIAVRLGFPSFLPYFSVDDPTTLYNEVKSSTAQTPESILAVHEEVATAKILAGICAQTALSRLWHFFGIRASAVVAHQQLFGPLACAGVLSDADIVYTAGSLVRVLLPQMIRHSDSKRMTLEQPCPDEVDIEFSQQEEERYKDIAKRVQFRRPRIPILFIGPGDRTTDTLFMPTGDLPENMFKPDAVWFARRLTLELRKHVEKVQTLEEAQLMSACQAHGIFPNRALMLEMSPRSRINGSTSKATNWSPRHGSALLNGAVEMNNDLWLALTSALRTMYNAGVEIRWDAFHRDLASSRPGKTPKIISSLPPNSWDLAEYWIPYKNDWVLRKGDPPLVCAAPQLESTTIHRVREDVEMDFGNKVRLVIEADISRDDLHGVVQGHVVDDVPLCTPSVYTDIALSVGTYLRCRYRPAIAERLVDVAQMNVSKALIARRQGPQILKVEVEVDWTKNEGQAKFSTVDKHNNPQQHASCLVCFRDVSLLQQLSQFDTFNSYKQFIRRLREGIATEQTIRYTRNMMYRHIRSLAEFHPDHRLVEDIVLDSVTHEATARVSFGTLTRYEGELYNGAHPAVVDALTQPAGFALNGADSTDLDREVYINHGWGSLVVLEKLDLARVYTVYTKMVAGTGDDAGKIWYGDIAVLDMDAKKVVAVFGGYSVQKLPRRALKILLQAEGGRAYKGQAAERPRSKSGRANSTHQERPARFQGPLHRQPTPQVEYLLPNAPCRPNSRETPRANSGQRTLNVDTHTPGTPVFSTLVDTPTKSARNPPPTTLPLPSVTIKPKQQRKKEDSTVTRAMQIIMEETGFEMEDLTDNIAFADAGVDSLLSLAILGRFREELPGSCLDSSLGLNGLFIECPTIGSLKSALTRRSGSDCENEQGDDNEDREQDEKPEDHVHYHTGYPTSSVDRQPPRARSHSHSTVVEIPQASSVLLQGLPKTATSTLFLFPDGSGSATSYASIPQISSTTCVVGLNSPFLRNPDVMATVLLDDLLDHGYLPEMKRRQPNGPYMLGGWSAGGTLAYRAAQKLLERGEKISRLILIDAPPPLDGMDPLPGSFYAWCENLGLFGGWSGGGSGNCSNENHKKPPGWLIPHFNATISVLRYYAATPLDRNMCKKSKLKAVCLWAAESVVDRPGVPALPPSPDDTEGMKFLTVRRRDFGPAGWDKLIPEGVKIMCGKLEGAHHFSLTREPYVSDLAAFICQVIA